MSKSGKSYCGAPDRDRPSLDGLYRDRENGWIFGVCAGLAEFMGIRALPVRIVLTAALILMFIPTAIAYLAATVFLRDRPLTYCGRRAEHDFWRSHHRDDHWSAS